MMKNYIPICADENRSDFSMQTSAVVLSKETERTRVAVSSLSSFQGTSIGGPFPLSRLIQAFLLVWLSSSLLAAH